MPHPPSPGEGDHARLRSVKEGDTCITAYTEAKACLNRKMLSRHRWLVVSMTDAGIPRYAADAGTHVLKNRIGASDLRGAALSPCRHDTGFNRLEWFHE